MIPTGTIVMLGKIISPSGFLFCNGAAVSRTTYAALFAAIGTVFGVGDGSTTFNVPDLTGRAIFGYKSGDATFGTLGNIGGAETINIQHSHAFAHTHASASASTGGPSAGLTCGSGGGGAFCASTHTHSGNANITSCTQSNSGSNNQLSATQSIIMRSITLYPLIAT